MKKILLKTNTRISANICAGGLNLTVHSPEIGELLQGEEKLAIYLWKNYDQIANSGNAVSFDDLVKYFVAPKDERKDYLGRIIQKNFWQNTFQHIKRTEVDRILPVRHNIIISPDTFLFKQDTLNLACLIDPGIRASKDFVYKGIFNKEFISKSIVPLLRIYSASLIKNFYQDTVGEYPENAEVLSRENLALAASE